MLSETGYLPDDTAIADDGLCQLFRCTECDCSNEYTDSNDGALIHLSTIHPFNDEDMEPETNHSDYAKRTFGFSE